MRQRDQSEIMSTLRQSPALNSLDPESRNEIFAEVGNLVQQQLVSSALSGEFRGVLEIAHPGITIMYCIQSYIATCYTVEPLNNVTFGISYSVH